MDSRNSSFFLKFILAVLCIMLMVEVGMIAFLYVTDGEVLILSLNLFNKVAFSIGDSV